MRGEKRGQAATEFLISYGWIILVITTSMVVLVLYANIDKASFVREECSLSAGLSCSDFYVDEGSITFLVKNNLDWNLDSVKFTFDDCVIDSNQRSLEMGETAAFSLSECSFTSGELFESNGLIVDYVFEGSNNIAHTKNVNIVTVVQGGNSQSFGGGSGGGYNPDGATLLLCNFDDGTDCVVGGSAIDSINVTIVSGYFDNSVFVEKDTNLIENGDFEGILPGYWNPYTQNNVSVGIISNLGNSGVNSALTTRDAGLLYPGFCDEVTCSYKSSCNWDHIAKTCSYSNACVQSCGTPAHICGAAPDIYNEGDELCWGNTNRVMYGGIRYGGEEDLDLSQNLNIVPGTDYALSFVYRGSFPQNLNVYICYSSGWCTQAQGYPVIYLDNVPLGDYLSWQYYSDSFTYAISFSTACGGSSCFREMILGKFNYGDTQIQGDNFYVDDVQLEEGSVAGPFAGDGSDILKYAADVTTLNLNVGTAEAWVYVDDNIRETSQNRYIFAHKGYLTFGYSNRLSLGHMTSNEWSYAITDSTGASESVTVPDTLSEGWHHFAVTWDKNTEGGYIEMFIDGASVGKKTNIASNFPDNYEDGIYVGSWSSGYGWTNTQIDDFRISDYVRY